jgi:hypothetical protein
MRVKSRLRYELKYLIRREQMRALQAELAERMVRDPFAGELGQYPITSLYFDSPDYKAYWDKLEGHRRRRKIRVRVYGSEQVTPQTSAFLEVKERINTRISKRRVALPYDEAIAFDDFDVPREGQTAQDSVVLHEVYYLYRTLQLRPAAVVHYDRMALEGQDYYLDLRVTFDTNLRGRTHDLSLLSTGHAAEQLLLPPDYVILEVKANQTVPLWMVRLLSRHGCTFFRISKYCAILERSKVIGARQRVIHAGGRETLHRIA